MISAGKQRCRPSVTGWLAGIVLILSIAHSASAVPFPGQEKVRHAAVLEKASRGEAQELLVVFDDSTAMQRAASMRAVSGADHDTPDILREKSLLFWGKKKEAIDLLTTDDAETIEDYDHLPVMFLRVKSLKGLQKLSSQRGVLGIYENQHYSLMLNQSLPLIGRPVVEAAGYTGAGTSVAVLDTGVDYSRNEFGICMGGVGDCLSLPAASAYCSVACVHDFAPSDGFLDIDGHGTNVSGIVVGVAPGAKIIGLDVFSGAGASFSVIANAINWVIANKAIYNIVALNLSLGVPDVKYTANCPSAFLNSVLNQARSAGILAAIASGNDGFKDGIADPACVPAAVSVGAVYDANVGSRSWSTVPVCTDTTTAADKVICFSNSANFLSILAPGALINAAGFTMAGTSQASPHVAGAIALLKSAFPAETPDQTLSRMTSSGVQVLDARSNITKPRIDLVAAINLSFTISGRVVSPKGLPVEGVTMTLGGAASASTVTDANGSYVFVDLSGGSYTVTPSKGTPGTITFTPLSRNVTVSGASVNVKDITAHVYSISGKVLTASGLPVSGVTVTMGGDGSAVALTGSTGKYIFSGLGNGTYTVTPAKTGYTFSPVSKTVSISGADKTGKNFTAITYAITGRVKTPSGSPMSNVIVSLIGDAAAVKKTDIYGRYGFNNLPNGSYVVTPSKAGNTFSPASINATVTGANVTKQNFVINP